MFGNAVLVLCLAFLVALCQAQDPVHTFNWRFSNNFVSSSFAECQDVPIFVVPLNSSTTDLGVPPYTLIAFEVGGSPTRQVIGSDPANLSWKVDHSAGSTLMLTIIDSKNNTGGIPSQLYNVESGSTQSCIPNKPDSSKLARLSSNVTDNLETCQMWGLTVEGGTKPYTIVLSALNSPVITTVPMGAQDDVFTYPNRADPNTQIMASVYDATGQWGIATKTIHTFGSTDYVCPGLESNSKTKAEVQQQAADAAAQLEAQRRQRRTRLILGIVLGITLPLIAIVAVIYWWWRRRKFLTDPSRGIYDGQDANVRAWNPTPPPPDPASGFVGYGGAEMREGVPHPISTTPSSKSLSSYPTNLGGGGYTVPLMSHAYSQSAPSDVYTPTGSTSGAATMSGDYSTSQWMSAGGSGSPGGALSPEMSPARRKAIEARAERVSSYPSTSLAGSSSSPLPPGASPASNPSFHSYDPEVRPDIIIQHRDGGSGVVQELPPPYVDRGTGSPHPPEGP